MRRGAFQECFELLIGELKEDSTVERSVRVQKILHFAQGVAKRGYEWHGKHRIVWYSLFKTMMLTNE